MKRVTLFILAILVGLLFIGASLYQPKQHPLSSTQDTGFEIPQDVQDILDNSCMGCHKSDSKNDKAKKKLMFDRLSELTKARLVGKLTEISEIVNKGDMPPKKVLDEYPDMALTNETTKIISDWADNQANSYLK
ncbi:MAG: hypothetical protein A2W85_17620 [Bacteroidetes bacterium GWF2_41_31]|nr:MAG: hypothetical protein A2W85_17620 [Bacteroidetes bacterium GWF2_41_31]OFZ04893.1 MAG: hypothetical protein A2338_05295 [Bacteroidetes bacterium RIFOXYB12_FULL_41_6]